jgi:hypothetical protein
MGLGVLLVPLGVPRLDLVDERGLRRDTAPQALTAQRAEFDLRHVAPTAVLRSIRDRSCIRDAFRLRRLNGVRQRSMGVGMPMVPHEANLLHVGIMLVHQVCDHVRPIHVCSLRRDCGLPLTCEWLQSSTNVCCPRPLVRCVIPSWLARLRWERSTNGPTQLSRPFVPTPWGPLRVIRCVRDIEDFCHVTDHGSIVRWWNAPCFLVPGLTCTVLKVRRMVSCDTAAITSHSTIVAASLRQVHRSCPSGA